MKSVLAKRLEKLARMVMAGAQVVASPHLESAEAALGELKEFIQSHRKEFSQVFGGFIIAANDWGGRNTQFYKVCEEITAFTVVLRENATSILKAVQKLRDMSEQMRDEVFSGEMRHFYTDKQLGGFWGVLDELVDVAEEAEAALEQCEHLRFYRVWLSNYNAIDVEADNAEDALEGAVAKAEKEGWVGLLEDPEAVREEALREGLIDPETNEESLEFEERYEYVDATMSGAKQPWYVNGLELGIEEI